jgi:hypothetical protein
MVVQLWEWAVLRDARANPVGVSMTPDRAKVALSRALVEAGRPARGSVRPVVLNTPYVRMPVTDVAVCERGVVRWEWPSGRGRRQIRSGVIERGGQALCGV